MCCTRVLGSAVSFTLRPAGFDLTAILRQVYQSTPNFLEHYIVIGTPYVLLVPQIPSFNLLHPTASCFRVTGRLETSASNDPKIPHHYNIKGQR